MKAKDYFGQGYNCSQSVLMQFCEKYGLDKDVAIRVASGMGGGMRAAEVCGAASGAAITIGLKHSPAGKPYAETKAECGKHTAEFMQAFKKEMGGLTCKHLLGCDINTPEGAERQSSGEFREKCTRFVERSAELLEELGY